MANLDKVKHPRKTYFDVSGVFCDEISYQIAIKCIDGLDTGMIILAIGGNDCIFRQNIADQIRACSGI